VLGPAVVPSLVRSTRAGRLLCLWPAPPRWCMAFALSSDAGAPGLLLTLASAALAEPPGAWLPVLGQQEERLADPRVMAISGRAQRSPGLPRQGLCSARQRSCRDEKGWNLPVLGTSPLAPAAPQRSRWFPCSPDVIPRPGAGSIAHDGDVGKRLEVLPGHGPDTGGQDNSFCALPIRLAGPARRLIPHPARANSMHSAESLAARSHLRGGWMHPLPPPASNAPSNQTGLPGFAD